MGLWPRPKQRRKQREAERRPPIAKLEGESPFAEGESLVAVERNEAAASLVDEDTYGYVLVRLVRDDSHGFEGRVEVKGHVRPEWRAPFLATLNRIIRHGLPTDP